MLQAIGGNVAQQLVCKLDKLNKVTESPERADSELRNTWRDSLRWCQTSRQPEKHGEVTTTTRISLCDAEAHRSTNSRA